MLIKSIFSLFFLCPKFLFDIHFKRRHFVYSNNVTWNVLRVWTATVIRYLLSLKRFPFTDDFPPRPPHDLSYINIGKVIHYTLEREFLYRLLSFFGGGSDWMHILISFIDLNQKGILIIDKRTVAQHPYRVWMCTHTLIANAELKKRTRKLHWIGAPLLACTFIYLSSNLAMSPLLYWPNVIHAILLLLLSVYLFK